MNNCSTINYAKDVCFYEMEVTVELCPRDVFFPKPTFKWYLALPYNDVLAKVQWYYDQGADAVTLKMLTQEQFDRTPNEPYEIKYIQDWHLVGDPKYKHS